MRDFTFTGWDTGSAAVSSGQLLDVRTSCLWWLDSSYTNQFKLLDLDWQKNNFVQSQSFEEAISELQERDFDIVIADVHLGKNWPTLTATEIADAARHVPDVLLLCSGSEPDAVNIQRHVRANHNTRVVMKERFSILDVIDYCNVCHKIRNAAPII